MNKKYIVYILVPVVLAIAIILGFFKKDVNFPIDNLGEEVTSLKTYTSSEYGFSFNYPDSYQIEEKIINNVNRNHKSIILLPKGYVPPEGGEGPTTINIDVYQNNLDQQSVETWIKGSSNSNYKLGDGIMTPVIIGGSSGLSYNWDGLYRGHTIALEHAENIIAISESFITPGDKIRSDYQTVINSLQLFPASKTTGSKLPQTLVENYLKENISTISPEKEVLGGKFYLTEVKLINGNSGVVSYEDGHVAFVADFTYAVSTEGKVTINSFVIRK